MIEIRTRDGNLFVPSEVSGESFERWRWGPQSPLRRRLTRLLKFGFGLMDNQSYEPGNKQLAAIPNCH